MIRKILTALAVVSLPATVGAGERSMIVLDASGSMWGQIDGTAKIEIARDTLGKVLGAVPEGNELGLIVYGHRRKGDCTDIELAVPAGIGTGNAITDFARGISPKGKTPLSAAVKKAADALKFTEDKATVILVTDGLETCEMDPCALGRELEAAGVDFTAHVVGFGLSAEESAKVSCLADETGGRYLEAGSADALGEALRQTVVVVAEPKPAPEPVVVPQPEPTKPEFNLEATASLAEGGPQLTDRKLYWELYAIQADGKVAKKRTAKVYGPTVETSLAAGDYELSVQLGAVRRIERIQLSEGEALTHHVVLNAGIIAAVGRRAPGGDIEKAIHITVQNGKARDRSYGEGRYYMPAGTVTVTGTHSGATSVEVFELAAGQVIQADVIVGTGVLVAGALYSKEGPEVESNDIRYTAYKAKADLDGKRKKVDRTSGGKPMNLPVGDYVIGALLGQVETFSAPVKVEAGARSDIQIILDAGVAAISAPGGHRIHILGKKNIQGERKAVSRKSGEEYTETLPAGSYLARVTYESDLAPIEAPLQVTAGERTELVLEAISVK